MTLAVSRRDRCLKLFRGLLCLNENRATHYYVARKKISTTSAKGTALAYAKVVTDIAILGLFALLVNRRDGSDVERPFRARQIRVFRRDRRAFLFAGGAGDDRSRNATRATTGLQVPLAPFNAVAGAIVRLRVLVNVTVRDRVATFVADRAIVAVEFFRRVHAGIVTLNDADSLFDKIIIVDVYRGYFDRRDLT